MELVYQICKCLYIPYFAFGILCLLSLSLHNKKFFLLLLSVCVVMCSWRLFLNTFSSRYCSAFLLLFLVAFSLSYKHLSSLRPFRIFSFVLFCFLFLFNCINLFSSYRNNYIFDLQDDFLFFLSNNKDNRIFLDETNSLRLSSIYTPSGCKQLFYLRSALFNIKNNPSDFFYQHSFSDHDYYFCSEKGILDKTFYLTTTEDSSLQANPIKFYKIRNYITNKQKDRFFSVYTHDLISSSMFSCGADFSSLDYMKEVKEHGVLKVYQPLFDYYLFQVRNKLLWFVGSNVEKVTEFHYHVHTDYPDRLPQKFIQSGCENLSFLPGINCTELPSFGHYRVFEKNIPTGYPISKIRVGCKTKDAIVWLFFFPPDPVSH